MGVFKAGGDQRVRLPPIRNSWVPHAGVFPDRRVFHGHAVAAARVAGLAAHRLRRVGLPFLVGCFAIIPLNEWVMSGGKLELAHLPWAWMDSLHHLWFLWVLMILVGVFIVAARVGAVFSSRLWWVAIPLILLPQMLMAEPIFGPDTSDGIVPDPVVLGYYALFFGFGSFCHQQHVVVSKRWAATLPFTLLPVFFAGLIVTYEFPGAWGRILSAVLQVGYAWLMCFGLMGLFRWVAGAERPWVRYLSDASYWIYLWHLPLVVGGQWLMLDWPVNPHLKFLALCLAVPGVLLIVYELGVRYTPVGVMLNGRRTRIGLPATGAASGP